ncbi:MAG: hypothetical protein ACMG6S_22155, partial [Byssovorax sp.]
MRRSLAPLLVLLAACSAAPPPDLSPFGPPRGGPAAPLVAVAPPPSPSAAPPTPPLAPSVEPTGSGIPLDAPAAALPAPSPPPSVARGTGTAADKLLARGDAAFAASDFVAAEKAYREAGAADRQDPAAIVGAVRA